MQDRTCANCQHHGDDFINIYMDWCNREDSAYYNELTNNDQYCDAWEAKEDGTAKAD